MRSCKAAAAGRWLSSLTVELSHTKTSLKLAIALQDKYINHIVMILPIILAI
ncbi:hypothetical protein [Nostoc sp.]|uniref:hypothetical protein n=1 Tax=Nostoc sp. TaxID=1180 RepID=UPI002FF7F616